jgi:hypothetical protein
MISLKLIITIVFFLSKTFSASPRIDIDDWKLAGIVISNYRFQFANRQYFLVEIEANSIYVVMDRELNKSLFRDVENDQQLKDKIRPLLADRMNNSFSSMKDFVSSVVDFSVVSKNGNQYSCSCTVWSTKHYCPCELAIKLSRREVLYFFF